MYEIFTRNKYKFVLQSDIINIQTASKRNLKQGHCTSKYCSMTCEHVLNHQILCSTSIAFGKHLLHISPNKLDVLHIRIWEISQTSRCIMVYSVSLWHAVYSYCQVLGLWLLHGILDWMIGTTETNTLNLQLQVVQHYRWYPHSTIPCYIH
jgi:hypothetical protein